MGFGLGRKINRSAGARNRFNLQNLIGFLDVDNAAVDRETIERFAGFNERLAPLLRVGGFYLCSIPLCAVAQR